ncbi:MAG: serine/threonine-protein kinase [Polyangiales bacterium]
MVSVGLGTVSWGSGATKRRRDDTPTLRQTAPVGEVRRAGGREATDTVPTRLPESRVSEISGLALLEQVEAVGRFHLCAELGAGGFATVYLAYTTGPGGFEKFVALKRLHPHLARKPEFVEMFLDEARIVASIQHLNVCPVFEFGECDGTYYLAMDYVLGEPLARVLRALKRDEHRLSRAQRYGFAATVLGHAALGLHAAHEAVAPDGRPLHVVHRDVAPGNLFVRYDGHVQVLDFGIAFSRANRHHTATGTAKGQLAYMSPEQFRGRAVDRRSDLWSLGVILWECLAGSRLFRRSSPVNTMYAVMHEAPPPIRQIDPHVPAALEAVLARSLHSDPRQRYSSAREMGEALLDYARQAEEAVGIQEVARFMEALFPGGKQRKYRLLSKARRGEFSGVPSIQSNTTPSDLSDLSIESLTGTLGARTQQLWRAWCLWVLRRSAQLPRRVWVLVAVCALLAFVGVWRWQHAGPESDRDAATAAPKAATAPLPRVRAREARAPAAVPKAAAAPPASLARPRTAVAALPRPTPRKPDPLPAWPRTGYVHLWSPAGAMHVYLDSLYLGRAPADFKLPAGWQELRFVRVEGSAERVLRVRVRAGRGKRVKVEFAGIAP